MKRMRASQLRHLLFLVLGAIGLRVLCFQGLQYSDDLALMEQAWRVVLGQFRVGGEWQGVLLPGMGAPNYPQRVGAFFPIALAFNVFGVTELAAYAVTMISSCVLVVTAYLSARRIFSPRAGVFAAILFSILPAAVWSATTVSAQWMAAASGNLALALISLWAFDKGGSKRWIIAWVGGIVLGFTWLTSEEIAFSCLWLGGMFLYSVGRRLYSTTRFLAVVALSTLAVLVGEACVYRVLTGDWFFRIHRMEEDYGVAAATSACFMQPLSAENWRAVMKCIVLDNPKTILFSWDHAASGALGLIAILRARYFADRRFVLPALWFVAMAVMFDLGSVSTKGYRPLILDSEQLVYLSFPAILLAAGMLDDLLPRFRSFATTSEKHFWGLVIAGLICMICGIPLLFSVHGGSLRKPEAQVANVLTEKDTVYTDGRSQAAIMFHRGIPQDPNVRSFDTVGSGELKGGDYVFVNLGRVRFLAEYYGYKAPDWIESVPSSWRVVWKQAASTLYRVETIGVGR